MRQSEKPLKKGTVRGQLVPRAMLKCSHLLLFIAPIRRRSGGEKRAHIH